MISNIIHLSSDIFHHSPYLEHGTLICLLSYSVLILQIKNIGSKPQNTLVQFFRALAIIAVVMIHTTPLGLSQVVFRPFINFSVAAFLFISGYLTKTDNTNWLAFYRKRILRVLIPYVIWTIIYSFQSIQNGGEGKVLLFNILTTKAAAPLYYIFVYIQFVLLTPLLGKLAKSKYRYIGWIIAPISIIIFKYSQFINGLEFSWIISLLWSVACLGWFTFYYLGLLLGNHIIELKYSLKKLTLLYVLSILIQMIEGYIWLKLGDINCGTQMKLSSLLSSSIFAMITYTLLERRKFDANRYKLMCVIGNYSFGIYLCHILIIRILSRTPCYGNIPYPLISFIVLALSLSFCYIVDKVCGKQLSRWLGIR